MKNSKGQSVLDHHATTDNLSVVVLNGDKCLNGLKGLIKGNPKAREKVQEMCNSSFLLVSMG